MLPMLQSQVDSPTLPYYFQSNLSSSPTLSPFLPYSLVSALCSLNATASQRTGQPPNDSYEGKRPSRACAGRPLCIEDRKRIVALYREGNRVSHIARLIGVTHSCVSKIMTRYRRTGTVHPGIVNRHFATDYSTNKEETLVIKDPIRALKRSDDVSKSDDVHISSLPLPFSIERLLSEELSESPPKLSPITSPSIGSDEGGRDATASL